MDAVIPGLRQSVIMDGAGADAMGLVTASPGATTVLGRLKAIATALANLTKAYAGGYETVAASQTAQVLGATGAAGDYIKGVLVIPATTGAGSIALLDGATSISIFVAGTLSDLKPFFIPLDMISVSGAWKLTTGANVSAIGIGNFT